MRPMRRVGLVVIALVALAVCAGHAAMGAALAQERSSGATRISAVHRRTIRVEGNPAALAWHPDGRRLASAAGSEISIWSDETGGLLQRLDDRPSGVTDLAFSPDGRLVAAARSVWGANDGRVIALWETSTYRQVQTLPGVSAPGGNAAVAVAFNGDGSLIAGRLGAGVTRVYALPSGALRATVDSTQGMDGPLAFDPAGTSLALSVRGRPLAYEVRLVDGASGRVVHAFKDYNFPIAALAFSPDARWLVCADHNGLVTVFDLRARARQRVFQGHPDQPRLVGFLRDGVHFVTLARDGALKLWHVTRPSPLGTLAAQQQLVVSAALSPDRRKVAIATELAIHTWEIVERSVPSAR